MYLENKIQAMYKKLLSYVKNSDVRVSLKLQLNI